MPKDRFLLILIPLIVWSLVWKSLALWSSARRGEKWWFIAFMVVNTAGVLELIYLFALDQRRPPVQPLPKERP
ncbi:MAG: hypothetical protein RL272_200 [Candidatus Parcubacteria bacterium]|jgi:hypothetical protein